APVQVSALLSRHALPALDASEEPLHSRPVLPGHVLHLAFAAVEFLDLSRVWMPGGNQILRSREQEDVRLRLVQVARQPALRLTADRRDRQTKPEPEGSVRVTTVVGQLHLRRQVASTRRDRQRDADRSRARRRIHGELLANTPNGPSAFRQRHCRQQRRATGWPAALRPTLAGCTSTPRATPTRRGRPHL